MFSLSQALVLTEDASSGGLLRVRSLGHSQDHIAVHVCMLPRVQFPTRGIVPRIELVRARSEGPPRALSMQLCQGCDVPRPERASRDQYDAVQ